MSKTSFVTNRFSKVQLIVFAVVFAALGAYLVWRTFALGPALAKVEAEAMTLPAGSSVIADASASGGQAALLTVNGSLISNLTTSAPAAHLEVIAKSNSCKGSNAVIQVKINNADVGGPKTVSSTSYQAIGIDLSPNLPAGTHNIAISYSNNIQRTKGKPCNRNLTVDTVTLYGSEASAPLPTVTLTANPANISAGQTSTLNWSSTDANACTASGGWSGNREPSGSASTGQLSLTTVYNLSCTGPGGTATASTTVTVQPQPTSPYMFINPQSLSSSAGSSFTVDIREDSLTAAVNAVQANLVYPADKLEVVNIDASASDFTVEAQSESTPGAVKVARGIVGSLTGDKLIAKLTFKVKAGVSGPVDVSFVQGTYLVSASNNQDILGSLANTRSLRLQVN